jgi:SAM-dependent methyltransferase
MEHTMTSMTASPAAKSDAPRQHWFPAASANRQPSSWWYFMRAVYVSRRDYRRIFLKFVAVGVPLGAAGVLLRQPLLLDAAIGLAVIGLLLLAYSLFGLHRMYGHPAAAYMRRLLALGGVSGRVAVADLHIGTYRHAYALATELPEATIQSVDCWNVDGPPAEEAVQDVRDLEPPPQDNPRIRCSRARDFAVPLADNSCDVVVFGFGTHEVPADGPREKLFDEADRILKPGGTLLLFEHGKDLHNFLIFGPVIGHVTERQEWVEFLRPRFDAVRHARSSAAVDLIAATRHAR